MAQQRAEISRIRHPHHTPTRLARFIDQRIGEPHHKTQADIAQEAGFRNANFVSMLKIGCSKLALDRVPSLAKALDVDPAFLMRLAIIRDTSSGRDPAPCARSEAAVRGGFRHGA